MCRCSGSESPSRVVTRGDGQRFAADDTKRGRDLVKTTMRRLGLVGFLVAVALALAACGGNAGGGQGGGGQGGMEGMDHSGMDHGEGGMGGEQMARKMLEDENGDYSDKRFIDMMVPHHEGAVEMAEVALENSDRPEILDLSRDIVRTQNAEIGELRNIKQEEFGTSKIPTGMGEGEMEMMGMMDPDELARQRPFDRAFIDAMIPHHQSAIDMANVVLEESDNPRLRELATNIIEAQEREITQMEQWRQQWYGQG